MQRERSAPFGIFGCGGFGREVAWLARSDPAARHHPLCFVDDAPGPDDVATGDAADDPAAGETVTVETASGETVRHVAGLPVLTFERFVERHDDVPLSLAIAGPAARRSVAGRLEAGGRRMITLVHDRVRLAPSVEIGAGSIVCEGSLLTVDIALGRCVHVNLGCTIGHDVRIGDFVTLSPGVHVSGNVTIEDGAFVGTGATIINGLPGAPLVVGAGGVIGAGAVVTASTRPGTLHVGVPARPVESKRRS